MKTLRLTIAGIGLILLIDIPAAAGMIDMQAIERLNTDDMHVLDSSVTLMQDLELLVFQVRVRGSAGRTIPTKRGQLDGAPVLGYVFPTTLKSADIGYNDVEGIVALAVTAHPDFDDTPLWDEDNDRDPTNDGVVFHSHWVVLVEDTRVPGGLSVRSLDASDPAIRKPTTHPDMPIYLDSPGFNVVLKQDTLKVLVPAQRINFKTSFKYDVVTAYMQVNTSKTGPMLGVYRVFQVQSGDLRLPYPVHAQ